MKSSKKIVAIVFFGLLLSCQNSHNKDDLTDYLKDNWKSPTDYVIEKFDKHDYVFIGEYHRIKHDIDSHLSKIIKFKKT